jgi:hypothetical protein
MLKDSMMLEESAFVKLSEAVQRIHEQVHTSCGMTRGIHQPP